MHFRQCPEQLSSTVSFSLVLSREGLALQARNAPPTVLLLGSCLTLAAKVARCLDLAGLKPLILGTDQIRPLAWLPECRTFIRWDDARWAGSTLTGGVAQLNEICRHYEVDIVVPADFATTLYLAERRSQIAVAATGLLPDPRLMCDLHDKWLLTRRMERLGIQYPKSILAKSERHLLDHDLTYPIMTKPLDGSYGMGIRTYWSAAQLEEARQKGLSEAWPVLVQEYIEGVDVDMSFISENGKLLAHSIFRHGSHSRCFIEAPQLKAVVEALIADANYTGVGHIDTRYRDDGYHILELNPRFWGSLLYERRAGLNYPELAVRMGLSQPVAPVPLASLGVVLPSVRETAAGYLMAKAQKVYEAAEQWKSGQAGAGKADAR